MAITIRPVSPRFTLPLPLIVMLCLLPPGRASAADWTVIPTLRLRETYTDNARLAPAALAESDLISEISPGISVLGRSPRLDLSFAYSLQHLRYQRQPDSTRQQLLASANSKIAEDWFYLDARASLSQTNISAFGPQSVAGNLAGSNQSNVRSSDLSPYLRHHFRGVGDLEARYERSTVDSGDLLSVRTNTLLLKLVGDNSGRSWNWDLYCRRQDIADAALDDVRSTKLALTLSDQLNSRFGVFATLGREKDGYASTSAQAPEGRFWSLGGSWTPSVRSSFTLSAGQRFFGNTYALKASQRTRAAIWSLSYNEDITTTHAELSRLNGAGSAAFLDQLWRTSIPDDLARQQQIATFLMLTQLLGEAGVVNYFSHRYYLQKQWQLSMATVGRKSTLALGATLTRRTAQTSAGIDSALLGPAELALQDRTRQHSLSAGWSTRLTRRDNLNLALASTGVDSLDTGRKDANLAMTAGLSRTVRSDVNLAIDLRHVRHHSNRGGDYRENALSATLNLRF